MCISVTFKTRILLCFVGKLFCHINVKILMWQSNLKQSNRKSCEQDFLFKHHVNKVFGQLLPCWQPSNATCSGAKRRMLSDEGFFFLGCNILPWQKLGRGEGSHHWSVHVCFRSSFSEDAFRLWAQNPRRKRLVPPKISVIYATFFSYWTIIGAKTGLLFLSVSHLLLLIFVHKATTITSPRIH